MFVNACLIAEVFHLDAKWQLGKASLETGGWPWSHTVIHQAEGASPVPRVWGPGRKAAGNMYNEGTNTYTFDAEGNITAVTGSTAATYVYNALIQRVRTVTSSATTEYVFNAAGQRTAL